MGFKFTKQPIPDIVLIEPDCYEDERGAFIETYKDSLFRANDIPSSFAQDNQSESSKNVLRGLHYQLIPKAHGKMVRVVSGKGFDVSVDIRKGSPYYGKWVGVELSANNRRILWVPEGFAHGFLSLEDNTVLLYKQTAEYSREHERGIIWNDPAIGIKWPTSRPVLSEKDRLLPVLEHADNNF